MSAQHSPGPWEVDTIRNDGEYGNRGPDTRSGFNSYVVFDANGRALFDSSNSDAIEVEEDGDGGAWDAVGKVNLTLAAAAPELLSIARRWLALDGGAWNVERHSIEQAELLADTRTAIASASPQPTALEQNK